MVGLDPASKAGVHSSHLTPNSEPKLKQAFVCVSFGCQFTTFYRSSEKTGRCCECPSRVCSWSCANYSSEAGLVLSGPEPDDHWSDWQAGLFGGLIGHEVDKSLMVAELDEDGEVHLHSSTLDQFEHFWKFYVDIGLVLLSPHIVTITNALLLNLWKLQV